MVDVPEKYHQLLSGTDGHHRSPDLAWSAGAYVCHVTDNLRIWAERVAGAALGGGRTVSGYDPDLLADSRNYPTIPLEGALWSLGNAVRDWTTALQLGLERGIVLLHSERGVQTAIDVARNNTHDAVHHGWDISRCLGMHDPPSGAVRPP